tara:strand:- start:999 stop:1946 length:948 start_codon:yes stop_codon:yes gene_type:complete
MKVIVTGCVGFIGFHLTKKLLSFGIDVIGIDNIDDYYSIKLKFDRLKTLKLNKQFKFIKNDINHINKLDFKVDLLINLAAQAGVRLPEKQNFKYVNSNINGFRSILNFADRFQIEKIIFASSSSVYSGISSFPLTESKELQEPTSKYAESKILNEHDALVFSKKRRAKLIGLRFFTVYGPWGRPDMAYYSFTTNIIKNKNITLFNNGNTYRDFTYIDDIVDGILKSIDYFDHMESYYEIFNLGNSCPISTTEILNIIESRLNKSTNIISIPRANEVEKTWASIEKSSECLGFQPKKNINDGMNNFLDWYMDYYKI